MYFYYVKEKEIITIKTETQCDNRGNKKNENFKSTNRRIKKRSN